MGTLTNTLELSMQRRATKALITADPTSIVLFPNAGSLVNGTLKFTPGSARNPQTFKVIWDGSNGVARQVGNEGESRRFDFVLVGEHDAVLAIGDVWKVADQKFVIEYIFPSNGWEVKAGGSSHGSVPT